MTNNYEYIIHKIKEDNWPVIIYGLGQLGQFISVELLELAGIQPKYACDKKTESIENFVNKHLEIKKMSITELYSVNNDVVVFVCVGVEHIWGVCCEMACNEHIHVLTIDDVTNQDTVLEHFYGINDISRNCLYKKKNLDVSSMLIERNNSNRIAIYTCVTGGYDVIKEPLCIEENCDYYLISDKKPEYLSVYQWINVSEIVPEQFTDAVVQNRWCKFNGYKIFPDYRYSIYLDGSMRIVRPISNYIKRIGSAGIALHKHSLRDCLYEEGLRIYANRRGNYSKEVIVEQMKKYYSIGMPRHYGLFECGVIVSDHNNRIMVELMEQWFDEFVKSVRRDQFSFPFILWKNGISADQIGVLNNGNDVRKNSDIILNEKHGT